MSAVTSFSELVLAAPVLQAVAEIGYEAPSPIQAESIPPLLEGRDVLGMAQTGTGKTAAFALPLLSRIDPAQRFPQVLVLAPTRELAIQVAEAMQTYARHLPGFHVLPIYGGQSMEPQLRALRRGAQIVVGTPGRVQDHLRRGSLQLDRLQAVVLDEADEMLRMGFIDDVEDILQRTPSQRQVALFSATMPEAIRRIAHTYLNDPVEIRIKSQTSTVTATTQRYWLVEGLNKLEALTRILEVEEADAWIVFVRTKTATAELAEKLEARGYAAAALNGDMNQAMREQTVEKLKRGALDIVVATDVAARGLDVSRISHVINYDIPYDTEAYVHRIGRTGRAGRSGDAILFVAPRERRMLRTIERATGQRIEQMRLPSRADIADRRAERFKQRITETLESQDLAFFHELIDGYTQENEQSPTAVAAALAFLLQEERPLVPQLPEPRTTETGRRAARSERDSRAPREDRRPRRSSRDEDDEIGPTVSYRIEVGRAHGVEPKNIVGAIANEAGMESRHIGAIDIQDEYSTVDLPEGMPTGIFKHLQKVWVCGRQLRISVAGEGLGGSRPPARKPKLSVNGGRSRKDAAGQSAKAPKSFKSAKPKRSAKPKTARRKPPTD
ncbi:DEAD/DEAH box helicase [Acidihalobacter ferrooxydans]|uniref:ATP-dependent RNA helicase DeaD n=1 Tax=Acidihalobacter ferrooxydans TaxID=1765967 RepID=A0A1P8UKA1_9GAMM|nr:DEAD/DEAH box helicase [Acidihalobacter ferrooxydans]APZ44182.1 ATP-dependent RNA helicase [Acidihalobacter ferrooxydans]